MLSSDTHREIHIRFSEDRAEAERHSDIDSGDRSPCDLWMAGFEHELCNLGLE
jgi:hypothetical protein